MFGKKGPKEKKEKKPKEKKEKKPKEKKEKKPKDPSKKKGSKKFPLPVLILLVAAVGAAAFFFLGKKDGGEEKPKLPELPTTYQIGDQAIIALTPGEGEEDSEILALQAKTVTYTYEGLKDAGKAAQNYIVELASREQGYAVVGEDFVRQAPPDFDTLEGTIYMAKAVEVPESEEEDKADSSQADSSQTDGSQADGSQADSAQEEKPDRLLTVRVTWSEGKCVVTADEAEGKITTPPLNDPDVGGRPSVPSAGMTSTSSIDYLYSMEPAQLGLPGDSMEDYQIIPMDGTRMVDGHMCFQLNVYGSNELGSNEFLGTFMMSLDGNYLYRWDMDTGEATLVER